MEWFAAADYDVARTVLQRGVGLVYLLAFLNVRNQFRPLLGERGLLPVPTFLERTSFADAPSLFHWRFSDRLVGFVAWLGMTGAAFVVVGGVDLVAPAAGMAVWLMLWILYLSIVNVGQTFYGFGWESLLLEAGFLVAFLGSAETGTAWPVLLAFRWLLFRVEFGAGLIKMRGDRCWRDLTCLDYHHETQPMPNPASRWFHRLPRPLHRVEVAANHVAQLVAPLALFLPQPAAGVAAILMVVTQAYLVLSGNYAWLNLITIVLAFSAIPDPWYAGLGVAGGAGGSAPTWFAAVGMAVALGVVVLSYRPVRNLLGGHQLMNYSFNRYHLVNTYGAFGSVTRVRDEVIVEGATAEANGGLRWLAYEFAGKPGDPLRRPRQWAPYHLRLDWMMWFLALSPSYGRPWFERMLVGLLSADPGLLRLLRVDPFEGRPPDVVRARLVRYRFAAAGEHRYWRTGPERPLVDPVSLRDGRLVRNPPPGASGWNGGIT